MLRGFLKILLLVSTVSIARADSCNKNCNTSCNTTCSSTPCNTNQSICNDTCNTNNCDGDVFGKTHYSLRPQDLNGARKLVGVKDKIHLYGKDEFYGVVSLGLMYQQTFDSKKLGRWFSFSRTFTTAASSSSNCCNTSCTTDCNRSNCMTYGNKCDGTFDIYGANFGTTNSGTICFNPQIRNFIADFDLWMGWDEFVCGLWTRIGVPVNYTKWDLRACDSNTSSTVSTFTAGFMGTHAAGTVNGFGSLLQGWAGNAFGSVPGLTCGKICGSRKDTQVAALHFDVGYDFYSCERGHVAASLHFVAPTGTKPSDEFLFNAVSGPQHMWQVGGTVDAGYQLWENCDGDQRLNIYFDAVVTHLFAAKQNRLFGLLINGQSSPGSSWLLLKTFNSSKEATGLQRAANVLCCCSKFDAGVMADVTLMLQYDCGCFSSGLGWNFWTRSREKIKEINCDLAAQNVGIKGDTPFQNPDGSANNETQSKSTISKCSAVETTPVLLTNDNIDVCPALHTSAFSNKIFGFFGYNWRDCDWQPFLLIEGGAEFGQDNRAANQWEVMLKGGVAF